MLWSLSCSPADYHPAVDESIMRLNHTHAFELNLHCSNPSQLRTQISLLDFEATMGLPSQAPQFEPLFGPNSTHDQIERPFTPVAHDLIVINQDGQPQIARNTSAQQMIEILQSSNTRCASAHGGDRDDIATLTLM